MASSHSPPHGGLTASNQGRCAGPEAGLLASRYSVARLLEGGPPPVRSGTFPEGHPQHTIEGLATGHGWDRDLMRFIQEVFLMLVLVGGCAFIEHPQFPVVGAAAWIHRVSGPGLPMKLLQDNRGSRCYKSLTNVCFGCLVAETHYDHPFAVYHGLTAGHSSGTGNMGRCQPFCC